MQADRLDEQRLALTRIVRAVESFVDMYSTYPSFSCMGARARTCNYQFSSVVYVDTIAAVLRVFPCTRPMALDAPRPGLTDAELQ